MREKNIMTSPTFLSFILNKEKTLTDKAKLKIEIKDGREA